MLESAPSSVFWTVCTTDVYKTGWGHIDENNYFTVFNRRGHGSSFPPDTGFELGIFSWKYLSAEAGVDYFGGADNPLYFNAGIAVQENQLFCHSPSVKAGIFNVGTRSKGYGRTNQNVVDFIVGKSLPECIGGRIFIGVYSGSRALGRVRQGYMVAFEYPFCAAKHCDNQEYFKWKFCGDYASGNNQIGGGGVGMFYYFTPDINILMGPTWFNSRSINGNWKWSVQIAMNFNIWGDDDDKSSEGRSGSCSP